MEQRAQLASAIVVPKITVLARHCWPSPAVTRLHSLIMDFVWGYVCKLVGISAARHARQGDVREVCRRAVSLTSRAAVTYNDDSSITIDVRRVIDDTLRAGMRAEVAASGRFDQRWLVHATLGCEIDGMRRITSTESNLQWVRITLARLCLG